MTITMPRKKYLLKSKLRFSVFITVLVLFIAMGLWVLLDSQGAVTADTQEYIQVQIADGDTLWQLAKDYMPKELDAREAVYIISNTNDLTSAEISPGQIIRIPKYNI